MPFLFYPTCSLSLSSFFFSFLFCFVFRLWLGPPTSLFPTETHFFEKEIKRNQTQQLLNIILIVSLSVLFEKITS